MLGIDFGAKSIKVVKLRKTGNGYHLDDFGIILSPPDSILHGEIKDVDVVSKALSKLLRTKNISDKNCNIGITGQKVIVREITTPLMNDKELIEGMQWEAPKYVPYDLQDSLLDAKIIEEIEEKEGTKMMKALLVATPKNLVEQQIAVIKNIKIQPKVVDIVANAQIRAFESYFTPIADSNEDGTLIDIILSIGASTTEITLLEGDRLKFTRTILKGGDDINRLIEKKLDIPFNEAENLKRQVGLLLPKTEESEKLKNSEEISIDKDPTTSNNNDPEPGINLTNTEDIENNQKTTLDKKEESIPNYDKIAELVNTGVTDIFNEIRKSLNYFKTQYQKVNFQRILLCGGMALLPNMGQVLKQQFGITVVIANPLKGISVNEHKVNIANLDEYKSALATAIGLAKRER